MLRDVTIRQTMHEMLGDEQVEVWLKIGAGAWTLDRTVDVEAGPTQDFEFLALTADVVHVMQTRAVREGRYRAGYLGGDPDAWPEQSRVEFIPGQDPAAAPTIVSASWDDATTTATVTVTPNPAHLDLDLELLRDGVVVDTIAAPHVGDVVFETVMASDEAVHNFTARHIVGGGLNGQQSDPPVPLWTGELTLYIDGVDYDSGVGENNMKIYWFYQGEGFTTLKLWWRWKLGSVDYDSIGGGGMEHDLGEVGPVWPTGNPREMEGDEFVPDYTLGQPGADQAHEFEVQLRAYDGVGALITSSDWADGVFFTPGP